MQELIHLFCIVPRHNLIYEQMLYGMDAAGGGADVLVVGAASVRDPCSKTVPYV